MNDQADAELAVGDSGPRLVLGFEAGGEIHALATAERGRLELYRGDRS